MEECNCSSARKLTGLIKVNELIKTVKEGSTKAREGIYFLIKIQCGNMAIWIHRLVCIPVQYYHQELLLSYQAIKESCTWVKWGKMLVMVVHKMVLGEIGEDVGGGGAQNDAGHGNGGGGGPH
jgi:hypothetical protein